LFTLALSVLTGLFFGAVPSLHATRPDVGLTLKNETGTLSLRSASARFRSGLVVAQVALSLLLLIGAGLFVRSLYNLNSLDPGFEPERLLAFSVDPSLNGYDLQRRLQVCARVRDEIAAEPGVRSVSLAEVALMTNSNWSSTVTVEGYEAKEGEDMNPNGNGVAPEFFSTLGMPLVAGRDFTEGDDLKASRVAIVNEAFARYFYGDEDSLGRRFGFGRAPEAWISIIGVVRDGKATSMREEPARVMYLPYTQRTDLGTVTFYVRAAMDPEHLGARIHDAVARVDSTLPVTDLKTMNRQIEESLFAERMVAALSVVFGTLATLLAAIGVYGVLAYAVSMRTREIGIRVALGAERGSVLLLVLKDVALLALLGIAIGLPLGFGVARMVESQLYGLSARDPVAIATATVVLLAAALLAGYLPALRASRVSPMTALRHD
ncbi:MAG: FtsX-like permease family protein, partial [Vicinamibacteria bacterium]